MQGYGFGFLIKFIGATMCRGFLQRESSTTLSIQYVIFLFLALSSNVHVICTNSFACLQKASSSCFVKISVNHISSDCILENLLERLRDIECYRGVNKEDVQV